MLCVGTGSVGWAEQYIPSGLAALLVTTVPLWMVLLDWLWKGGRRPGGIIFFGLLLGFAGVVLLVDPVAIVQNLSVDVFAALLILVGALSWSAGSIHGRTADLPKDPFMSTAMQMFAGGVLLAITGLVLGEGRHLDVGSISLRSFLGWGYLVVLGSFIAFSAYIWLLNNTSPARVATYAYVNPVVAVFLGWALADEPFNLRILFAIVLLVSAVVLITRHSQRRPESLEPRETPPRAHGLDPVARLHPLSRHAIRERILRSTGRATAEEGCDYTP